MGDSWLLVRHSGGEKRNQMRILPPQRSEPRIHRPSNSKAASRLHRENVQTAAGLGEMQHDAGAPPSRSSTGQAAGPTHQDTMAFAATGRAAEDPDTQAVFFWT